MFNLLDMNQDGNISFGDWQICYRCMGANTAIAKALFEVMDTDGEGMPEHNKIYELQNFKKSCPAQLQ